METFRTIAHIAAVNGWVLHQVDIKTAFLRGVLEPGEVLKFSGAVRRKGRIIRLSHYHGTSGLAQMREESVNTKVCMYTAQPHHSHETLVPNIRIFNKRRYT